MWKRWVLALALLPAAYGAAKPGDWVPVRWPWTDAQSLDLLKGSPVNCLLLREYPAELVKAAAERDLVTLAVLKPGGDVVAAARTAVAAKVSGLVLDGAFPDATVAAVREAAGGA